MTERPFQTADRSGERGHDGSRLAIALVAAVRSWTLYPREHPVVSVSVSTFITVVHELSFSAALSVGVTPDNLLLGGVAADPTKPGIAEAARLLHNCDVLHLTFLGQVPPEAISALLRVLTLDPAERRRLGGPANLWSTEGHPSIGLVQVDFAQLLALDENQVAEPAKRDELWQSIVLSIGGGEKASLGQSAQQRLLAIAGRAGDLVDLATAVVAPKCAMDGSPMVSSQADALLAAFRQLTDLVMVTTPESLSQIMNNLANAALELDPHVIIELLQCAQAGNDDPALRHLISAFDEDKMAKLLASTVSVDRRVPDRLASVFTRITPDQAGKRRVLALARNLLEETELGQSGQFSKLWTSAEELLLRYDDQPFTSEAYRAALDGVGGRADAMATDLPPELPEWMETLGSDNVRSLSVRLLIDLLNLEHDVARAANLVAEMETLTEDVLLSGAYGDALMIARALHAHCTKDDAIGRDACLRTLDRLGESVAMREVAASIEDMPDDDWSLVRTTIAAIGPSCVEPLKALLIVEQVTLATERAEDLVVEFGASAVPRLASLVGDAPWFAQREAARILNRIAAPEGVPLLRQLLRQGDTRVIPDAISALCGIKDAAAAQALQIVLRTATGQLRQLVIDALVANRDPRVIPLIARVLDASLPLSKDHHMVLDMLTALGVIGDEHAVPTLVTMSRRRAIFRRKKLRTIKQRAVDALVKIGGTAAATGLRQAAEDGDRMLKRIIAGTAKTEGTKSSSETGFHDASVIVMGKSQDGRT